MEEATFQCRFANLVGNHVGTQHIASSLLGNLSFRAWCFGALETLPDSETSKARGEQLAYMVVSQNWGPFYLVINYPFCGSQFWGAPICNSIRPSQNLYSNAPTNALKCIPLLTFFCHSKEENVFITINNTINYYKFWWNNWNNYFLNS